MNAPDNTPRKPLRKVVPASPVGRTVIAQKIALKKAPAPEAPSVGHSLLQPSTAFALSLAMQQQQKGGTEAAAMQARPSPQGRGTSSLSTATAERLPEMVLSQMEDLTLLLRKEIELVRKQDFNALGAIQSSKYRLVNTYEANAQAIAAQPDLVRRASEEMRKRLKAAGQLLDRVASENAAVLKGAMQATELTWKFFIGAIREENLPPPSTYGHLKTARLSSNAYSPLCPSVAVNRTA